MAAASQARRPARHYRVYWRRRRHDSNEADDVPRLHPPPGASSSARASDGLVNRADQFVSLSQAFFFARFAVLRCAALSCCGLFGAVLFLAGLVACALSAASGAGAGAACSRLFFAQYAFIFSD